jgi:chromosome segregation ATPase
MKNLTKTVVLVLAIAVVLTGCKQPTQLINDVKAAIESVTTAGADKYAAEELKAINDDLTKALDEVAAQDKKFFKKFGPAKEMLAAVMTKVTELKAALPAKIEAAKNAAIQLQSEAQAALTETAELLKKAPKGKGTAKDLEALQADLTGAQTMYTEIQAALDANDGAADKAKSVKDKVAAIAEQINAAIAKVKK